MVGINSQIYSRTGGYMGVSFAIPIDVAMQRRGAARRPPARSTRGKLGVAIQDVNQGLADSFGLPQPDGALVSSVEKGGPAEKAGIEPGDVILKLNGEPLKDSTELPVQIASVSPGTSVNLEIWRNHAARNLSVKLGAMERHAHRRQRRAPRRRGRQARAGGAAADPGRAAPGQHEGRPAWSSAPRALRPTPACSRATWCWPPTARR